MDRNLTPLCTLSHFTPAIINHNSNWPPLIPTGPLTPTIWAPISPPWAIHLSPPAWPTGQASSYLLCLCHTPLLLVLLREIWTPPCLPDSHLNPTAISLDLGDATNLPLHAEVRTRCQMGGYCNRYFNTLHWVRPVKANPRRCNLCQGKYCFSSWMKIQKHHNTTKVYRLLSAWLN